LDGWYRGHRHPIVTLEMLVLFTFVHLHSLLEEALQLRLRQSWDLSTQWAYPGRHSNFANTMIFAALNPRVARFQSLDART